MSAKKKDYAGMKFGSLLAISPTDKREKGAIVWKFKCLECNNDYYVTPFRVRERLNKGFNTTCGCVHGSTTHGNTSTRLYRVWSNMKNRCLNPNNVRYDDYGGRGINVCDDWLKFEKFLEWSNISGYSEGLTLDRINNNEGYNPHNCKWSDYKEQANNRRSSKLVEAISPRGESYIIDNVSEFISQNNLTRSKVYSVLNGKLHHTKGWKFLYV